MRVSGNGWRATGDVSGGRAKGGGGYKPIEDYGVIGNLRTAALVGRDGSIDWWCAPEFDDPAVFAALLDHRRGGRFRVAPRGAPMGEQVYLPETNVLRTLFRGGGGELAVTDFMDLEQPELETQPPSTQPAVFRLLECVEGKVEVEVEWSPRFDFGRADTRISPRTGGWVATGGHGRLVLGGLPAAPDVTDEEFGPILRATFPLRSGEKAALVTRFNERRLQAEVAHVERMRDRTADAWRAWSRAYGKERERVFGGEWQDEVARSSLALKLLTFPDTGAIVAAPTSSLPEDIGGVRNWDYRYAWLRDSAFAAQALMSVGRQAEALQFLDWTARVSMGELGQRQPLRIMYGLHGETELWEEELDDFEGYLGSSPVRLGNAAAEQRQLDIFGELLGSAFEYGRIGGDLGRHWEFLRYVADEACDAWRQPDRGIWELRGEPRHFVHSKVMVWMGLDRMISAVGKWGLEGDVPRWARARDEVRDAVLERGYDDDLGAFTQSFDCDALDASNLVLPIVGFVGFDDPRVQSTIDRTMERLMDNGLVYRYKADDGLPGEEGAWVVCTCWLISALALSGRVGEARELFQELAGRANHLGLYSEQIDPRTGAFLGNFPQAFSHIGFLNAARYLTRAEGRERGERPAPVGSGEHRRETGHAPGGAHP